MLSRDLQRSSHNPSAISQKILKFWNYRFFCMLFHLQSSKGYVRNFCMTPCLKNARFSHGLSLKPYQLTLFSQNKFSYA